MNNKGFTLIELLATIVILSLISSISVVTITSMYQNSKDKAEKIFKEELASMIEDYITLNNSKFNFNNIKECNDLANDEDNPGRKVGDNNTNLCPIIEKTKDDDGKETIIYDNNVNIYIAKKDKTGNTITLNNLITSGIINESDLINPKNKNVPCDKNTQIIIRRNNNYKYCFKTTPSMSCLTIGNKSINTCKD